jgi:hypothetical protein
MTPTKALGTSKIIRRSHPLTSGVIASKLGVQSDWTLVSDILAIQERTGGFEDVASPS